MGSQPRPVQVNVYTPCSTNPARVGKHLIMLIPPQCPADLASAFLQCTGTCQCRDRLHDVLQKREPLLTSFDLTGIADLIRAGACADVGPFMKHSHLLCTCSVLGTFAYESQTRSFFVARHRPPQLALTNQIRALAPAASLPIDAESESVLLNPKRCSMRSLPTVQAGRGASCAWSGPASASAPGSPTSAARARDFTASWRSTTCRTRRCLIPSVCSDQDALGVRHSGLP